MSLFGLFMIFILYTIEPACLQRHALHREGNRLPPSPDPRQDLGHLELGKHGIGAGDGDAPTRLVLCVNHLSVVNDQGISTSALAHSPADTLAKSSAVIGHEELRKKGWLAVVDSRRPDSVVSEEAGDIQWNRP